MKKQLTYLLSVLGIVFVHGCANEVRESYTYKINEPVFMPTAAFRQSVRVTAASGQSIGQQGKIAFFRDYLYISEPEKGIHIIDNRKSESPVFVGFIELLGNADMAIKDHLLYADSYIDLVWFDVSNPAKPVLKGRKEDVFPIALPATNNGYWCDFEKSMDKSNGVVVGWQVKERRGEYPANYLYRNDGLIGGEMEMKSSGTHSSVGATGSMSRFSINKNYLYTVLNNQLGVFDIAAAMPVKRGENIYIGANVETIFSYKEHLFMGTPTGMLIYSAANAPEKPEFQSALQHVYGCDPVVVENDIAYVTIHAGNNCGQNNNQLLAIDVKDVKKPVAIRTYEMTNPKGLGIDDNTLFVCDDGLKVYNAKDPKNLDTNQLAHIKGMNGYDLIAHNRLLMMIAADGIYQYDYADIQNIRQLSRIPIGK